MAQSAATVPLSAFLTLAGIGLLIVVALAVAWRADHCRGADARVFAQGAWALQGKDLRADYARKDDIHAQALGLLQGQITRAQDRDQAIIDSYARFERVVGALTEKTTMALAALAKDGEKYAMVIGALENEKGFLRRIAFEDRVFERAQENPLAAGQASGIGRRTHEEPGGLGAPQVVGLPPEGEDPGLSTPAPRAAHKPGQRGGAADRTLGFQVRELDPERSRDQPAPVLIVPGTSREPLPAAER